MCVFVFLGVYSLKIGSGRGDLFIFRLKWEENLVIDWGDIWWINKKKYRNKGNGKNFLVKLEKFYKKLWLYLF